MTCGTLSIVKPNQLEFSFGDDDHDHSDRDRFESQAIPSQDVHPSTSIASICGNIRHQLQRLRPPVKAHGGKYYLARQIVPVLLSAPGNPDEYLEPCAFGASVFLAMPRFRREILGDVNPDVVQLWRTLAHEHLSAVLAKRLAGVSYDEETFEAVGRAPRVKTPEGRAAR